MSFPSTVPEILANPVWVDRLEQVCAWLPPSPPTIDWTETWVCRWRSTTVFGSRRGWLDSGPVTNSLALEDLQHIKPQIDSIDRNTRQFLAGQPANNVLLTGARGTGKSSILRGLLARYAPQGLRLIQVDKDDLVQLSEILTLVPPLPWRCIVFCDDLSFDDHEPAYKALKVAIDGSFFAPDGRVLIYATSNRRNLMPESMDENLAAKMHSNGDIHPAETTEEKIALSERFGLWLSFPPFPQQAYLDIVQHWLQRLGCDANTIQAATGPALTWAITRGARSGRVAWQFAKDWAGRAAIDSPYQSTDKPSQTE